MKRLSIFFLLLLTVTSCLPKKGSTNNDPQPQLAGTYQVSLLIANGSTYNLPYQGSSASVLVTQPSDTQITFRLDTNDSGTVSIGQNIITATITKNSSSYDISTGLGRVGSIDGTNFSLDFTSNGSRFAITARK
jgi:hypothetical protein